MSNKEPWYTIKSERFWLLIFYLLEYWQLTSIAIFLIYLVLVPPFGTDYSKGQIEGKLQRYTVKGLIWKTGEGQLIMPNFKLSSGKYTSSGGNEELNFSDKQCRDFGAAIGHKVKLHYSKSLHSPYYMGDTRIRIDSMIVLD